MKRVTLFCLCSFLILKMASGQSVNVDLTTERSLMSKSLSSKIEAQTIIREGLDYLYKETQ